VATFFAVPERVLVSKYFTLPLMMLKLDFCENGTVILNHLRNWSCHWNNINSITEMLSYHHKNLQAISFSFLNGHKNFVIGFSEKSGLENQSSDLLY